MARSSPAFFADPSSLLVFNSGLCPICSSPDTTSEHSLCAACQQQILQSIEDITADQQVSIWQCPRCTLFNKFSNEQCEVCGKPKLSSASFYFM
jgi:RNA polymerase subunit RPABC4/transcription elongation factor Spt4